MIIFACFVRYDQHVAVAGKVVVDDSPVVVTLLLVSLAGNLVEELAIQPYCIEVLLER